MPGLETGRFKLPLLAVSQAQKEVTHNEALVLIDALLHMAVEGALPAAPEPNESDIGKCWLITGTPNDLWTNKSSEIAVWIGGSWRFVAPHEGMRMWNKSTGLQTFYKNGHWSSTTVISKPAQGEVVDVEARAAIDAILHYFSLIGIIATPAEKLGKVS